ncbi:4-oxalomesaconate tautomerase [Microbacterium sp. STN6]|uniref:4-oxalomesaconate tautomerase n=1 Tax=Microbacterium sp. STN6 TaxID=2995588 RepID=UPI002260B5E0|nr:4-oxalomesaconate tautomerase [Microbacterium sp. STN6]MCX7523328.1 4-oxalomesaconate tautomerase [Microbacterium sp. STN6]
MSADGIRCMLMRGGTSKGAYFLADDLPGDRAERDDLLLRVLGSPDARQIDGIGGGHPLTSKVAVVSASADSGADVDYLFLQVQVDEPIVSDSQTCGNLLAGVGPFAIERGLVEARDQTTDVRIRVMNGHGGTAIAHVATPGERVEYAGDVRISGVPFAAAAVSLEFPPASGPLLPTGHATDVLAGLTVTCVDAGMPVVLVTADALGIAGDETPAELEGDAALRGRVEALRLAAGSAMGLGDVSATTVPKISIVSPASNGGDIATRTFIPRRVHTSIGVVGAISVAAGALVPGSVGGGVLGSARTGSRVRIEHPTGFFDVEIELETNGGSPRVARSAVIRTARKLFDGTVWPRSGAE